ncbi:MAG: hypothetical protein EBR30_18665 [Cytophagia bacterium]|nr:hypothetical protein [Cytophagia bacterium]
MKNRSTIIIAILLVASIGSYFNVVSDGTIRTVEFLNIFAMGALTLESFFRFKLLLMKTDHPRLSSLGATLIGN